jgi:hypothetical protein
MSVSSSDAGAPRPRFASFRDFYPYYVQQHSHPVSRRLHVCGTLLALLIVLGAVASAHYLWLIAAPLAGYLPAWLGHFLFQRNLPATFCHPLYSLRGDFVMLAETLTGRRRW